MTCDTLWRLSVSEAGLARGYLFLRDIPPPSTSVYKTFSGEFSQSDGGFRQMGYTNVVMRWKYLTSAHAHRLTRYVEVSLAGSGILYATIAKNNATSVGRDYIDIRGIPRPMNIEEEGEIAGSGLLVVYQNVQLSINNIVVINDPALF